VKIWGIYKDYCGAFSLGNFLNPQGNKAIMIYYFDYALGGRVTGANLFYRRVAEILSKTPGAKGIKSFWGFVNSGIKRLSDGDVLITNTGPYAFIFHYLRQLNGQRFRIVRDVQTSLHASYLFQEMASGEFQRPGDAVLFPSNYTRNLYIRLFPNLNEKNTYVCYPCIEAFPKLKPKPKKEFIVGYLGSASVHKNFHQLVSIAPKLKCRILVAGELLCKPLANNMKYIGKLAPGGVWEFLQQISVLAFPSTANIESLGRVLLEANHLGIPSVVAEFGASPELSPNTAPVRLKQGEVDLVHNNNLGEVDEQLFQKLLLSAKSGSNSGYMHHDRKLHKILHNPSLQEELVDLNPRVQDFISKTKIYLNRDYNCAMSEAIECFIAALKKEDLSDIGVCTHNVFEAMGFNLKWSLY
jgi:hypothetical protein